MQTFSMREGFWKYLSHSVISIWWSITIVNESLFVQWYERLVFKDFLSVPVTPLPCPHTHLTLTPAITLRDNLNTGIDDGVWCIPILIKSFGFRKLHTRMKVNHGLDIFITVRVGSCLSSTCAVFSGDIW
jgi:hypothetical protein